ncbi:MAG: hypothetical protein AB7F99_03550 [Vicinamibacterales bacterium]
MLPAKIVQFLDQHANQGLAGIRDRDLRPSGCRVSAWRLAPDGHTLTAFIPMPERFQQEFLDALSDNGQIAVTIGERQSHETYQLKGTYLRHRMATPDDLPLVRRNRERFLKAIRAEIPPGLDPEPLLAQILPDPTFVVELDVREVYVQTPGPGAGARLHPPPDA